MDQQRFTVGRATQHDVTKIETKQLTKCLVMHQLSQFPHLLGQNLLLKQTGCDLPHQTWTKPLKCRSLLINLLIISRIKQLIGLKKGQIIIFNQFSIVNKTVANAICDSQLICS